MVLKLKGPQVSAGEASTNTQPTKVQAGRFHFDMKQSKHSEMAFFVRGDISMGMWMHRYAQWTVQPIETLIFLLNGARVEEGDTPTAVSCRSASLRHLSN